MSTSSTRKSLPSGVFQTLPGLNPLLARMIGAQPAQTFSEKPDGVVSPAACRPRCP